MSPATSSPGQRVECGRCGAQATAGSRPLVLLACTVCGGTDMRPLGHGEPRPADPPLASTVGPERERAPGAFGQAVRSVLLVLERRLEGAAAWVGHLDRDHGALRVLDASGARSFGLEAGLTLPLEESFCQPMAAGRAPRLSADAVADPVYGRLAVTEELGIGSYVGAPLQLSDGTPVGSLCAIHAAPRGLGPEELALVEGLAELLSAELVRQQDERDLRGLAERLREQALGDALTGLRNRRGLQDRLAARSSLRPTRWVLVDVVGLAAINARRGPAAGDRALVELAGLLRACAGEHDDLARLGGDELAVALAPGAMELDAQRLATRLYEAVEASLVARELGLRVRTEVPAPRSGAELPALAV